MIITLLENNKLGFICGSCKKEDLDLSLHHLWDRGNTFVFTWIMYAVSRDLLSNIIYSTSIFLVWNDLKERFDKVNDSRIYQLHRDICVTNQGLDSISIYFNRLKLLWDEFSAICSILTCSCE